MTRISRFTGEIVPIAQVVTGDGDESAAPEGGGGFADYALVSLHCLRIYLDTSYRMTIDLLKEMPQITGEIGLSTADLPSPSTLCKAFDRIDMSICQVLLRQSAQLHDPSRHAAIDATFYERSAASRHYCQRISYRVQKLKVTKLVDTETQAILDVHCSTTREGSDADLAEQIARRNAGDLRSLAADKGYDKQALREALRELGIRPLIKHFFTIGAHLKGEFGFEVQRPAVNLIGEIGPRKCFISGSLCEERRGDRLPVEFGLGQFFPSLRKGCLVLCRSTPELLEVELEEDPILAVWSEGDYEHSLGVLIEPRCRCRLVTEHIWVVTSIRERTLARLKPPVVRSGVLPDPDTAPVAPVTSAAAV